MTRRWGCQALLPLHQGQGGGSPPACPHPRYTYNSHEPPPTHPPGDRPNTQVMKVFEKMQALFPQAAGAGAFPPPPAAPAQQ